MGDKRSIVNGNLVEINEDNSLFSSKALKEVHLNLSNTVIDECSKKFEIFKLHGDFVIRCGFQESPKSAPIIAESKRQKIYAAYIAGDILSDCYVPYSMRYVSSTAFICIENFLKTIFKEIMEKENPDVETCNAIYHM